MQRMANDEVDELIEDYIVEMLTKGEITKEKDEKGVGKISSDTRKSSRGL